MITPQDRENNFPRATNKSKYDPNNTMYAVEWHGTQDVRVVERPKPCLTDPGDAIIKITTTAICGSDLHLYTNTMPGMKTGDILGHEFMGIVEEVGPTVTNLKRGDRVVVAFDIACGECYFCKNGWYTNCDGSNPEGDEQVPLYGTKTGGFFGYTHNCGGWDGGQAQYARVPFADHNCLKVPDHLKDEQVLFLSDILPTAWHGAELGFVGEGDIVAIWGAGPVGMLCALCCKLRGAKHIIMIDNQPYRLARIQSHLGADHCTTINFKTHSVKDEIKKLIPRGPDVGIECVGIHYTRSLLHKLEMATKWETDPADVIDEILTVVRKAGRVSVIGAYAGYTNQFNIGAFMEKGMTMRGGQTPVQRYWKMLLEKVEKKEIDPTMVITHDLVLDEAPRAYKLFNNKEEGCVKVIMRPQEFMKEQ